MAARVAGYHASTLLVVRLTYSVVSETNGRALRARIPEKGLMPIATDAAIGAPFPQTRNAHGSEPITRV